MRAETIKQTQDVYGMGVMNVRHAVLPCGGGCYVAAPRSTQLNEY